MEQWLKRAWAEIDLDALVYNARSIESRLTGGSRILAIVKADGYGHGAVEVARTLARCGVGYFGVSNLEEAIQLRRAGITEPVLILSHTPPEEAGRLLEFGITQTVLSAEHGEMLSRAAVQAGGRVKVHLKVDTGMTRVGFLYQDPERDRVSITDMAEICRLPGLEPEGIFTHFAVSDEPDGEAFTREQFSRFMRAVRELEERGIAFRYRHCCNSAATIRFPEMHLDLVRPGLILYGLMPAPWMNGMLPLRPLMALKSKVAMVKTVPAGATVSYGRQYTTTRDTRLATVSIGYADGYSRRLSGRGYMLVQGQRAPVVGRVCMDQCMLDVSGIPEVKADTTVTAFGRDGDAVLPVEEFAGWSDTINYEAVCEIGKRVTRVYLRDGEVVGQLNYLVP